MFMETLLLPPPLSLAFLYESIIQRRGFPDTSLHHFCRLLRTAVITVVELLWTPPKGCYNDTNSGIVIIKLNISLNKIREKGKDV